MIPMLFCVLLFVLLRRAAPGPEGEGPPALLGPGKGGGPLAGPGEGGWDGGRIRKAYIPCDIDNYIQLQQMHHTF